MAIYRFYQFFLLQVNVWTTAQSELGYYATLEIQGLHNPHDVWDYFLKSVSTDVR